MGAKLCGSEVARSKLSVNQLYEGSFYVNAAWCSHSQVSGVEAG